MPHVKRVLISLDQESYDFINRVAEKLRTSRSQLIRIATIYYVFNEFPSLYERIRDEQEKEGRKSARD
ncbi:MAG: ribbon-helix-helix protein, CopG family [Candidatus Korarchaeum sp.]